MYYLRAEVYSALSSAVPGSMGSIIALVVPFQRCLLLPDSVRTEVCLALASSCRHALITSAVCLDLAAHLTGICLEAGPGGSRPAAIASAAVVIFKRSSVAAQPYCLCLDLAVLCWSDHDLVSPPI